MKHVISINDFGKEEIFDEILPACQDRIKFARKREIESQRVRILQLFINITTEYLFFYERICKVNLFHFS